MTSAADRPTAPATNRGGPGRGAHGEPDRAGRKIGAAGASHDKEGRPVSRRLAERERRLQSGWMRLGVAPPDAPDRKPRAARPEPGNDDARRLLRKRILMLMLVLFTSTVLSVVVNIHSPVRSYVIPTDSMDPTIPAGSLLTVGPGEIQEGDIIVFHSPIGRDLAHRVIGIEEGPDGRVQYRTQGDALEASDSFLVPEEHVVGVYIRHVPYIGYLWMMPLWLQATLFGTFILSYLSIALWDARKTFRVGKKWGAVLLVMVLAAPGAFGGVNVAPPDATTTLGDLTGENPMPLGDGDFGMGDTSLASDNNTAETALGEPLLWKEIEMLNCNTGAGISSSDCVAFGSSTSYTYSDGSIFRLSNIPSPTPTFYLEATMGISGSPTAAYAAISEHGLSESPISGSEVSTTMNGAYDLVRSDPFTLTLDKDYKFGLKIDGSGGFAVAKSVKLIMVQELEPTLADRSTSTYIRMAMGDQVSADGALSGASPWEDVEKSGAWVYDGDRYDGTVSGIFRVTADRNDGGLLNSGGAVRLLENGSQVAILIIPKGDLVKTYSAGFTLTPGAEYTVEYRARNGGGTGTHTLDLYNAHIEVQQDAFTKTERVIDLTNPITADGTSYGEVGYTGRYHADSEWGNATGELQATLSVDGASTGHLRLLADPTGAATVKEDVQVGGGGKTLVVSDPFTMLDGNVTYGVEGMRGPGAAVATIYGARFVVPQVFGKTYYGVVDTMPTGTSCTWDHTLVYASSTDLSNVDYLEIRINRTDTNETQIIASGGTISQSSGTAITVADGQRLYATAYFVPGSTDAAALTADLYARCGGVHVKRPITFDFLDGTGTQIQI